MFYSRTTNNHQLLSKRNLHTPIILSNFDPTFGGAFKAEITPFEPDPGNTGEGKKSIAILSISSFLLPPFLVRKPMPNRGVHTVFVLWQFDN